MTSGAVIEVRDVCFAYGGQEVLHNASFAVPARAFVAVVGPNGGGKTTLLKLLLGEVAPRFGAIRVLGGDPAAVRRRIGYVPQALPFDPAYPVSVRDVVLMGRVGSRPFGPYRAADRAAADAALAQLGLEGFGRRGFTGLSGGERQRVLIAQALIGDPELLLLDEPTASVDAETSSRLHDLFSEWKTARTIVMVSHNLGVVTGHATHVLCVNRTAELHTMEEVAAGTVREAFGGSLAVLAHGPHCHVIDSSAVMDTPHSAAVGSGAP